MRNPNGYGSIVRLCGRRRKQYAVRISAGYKERICVQNKAEYLSLIGKLPMSFRKSKNDYAGYLDATAVNKLESANIPYRTEFVRQYKYLEYFEKSKDAHMYLAQMNRGEEIKEHTSIASGPTFKRVYEQYIDFLMSLNQKPSETTLKAYKTGFMSWSDIHDIRFRAVTTKQLQDCLTSQGTKSKSTVTRMITVLKKLYKYALAHQICDTDLSPYLFSEYSKSQKNAHSPYSDDEIAMLWQNADKESAKVMLILIYTGMRCSEFLEMKKENVHIEDRYMIGGIKTEAGKNRVIPIHKRIVPLIEYFYKLNKSNLYETSVHTEYTYPHFREKRWNKYKKELNLSHMTHDCRHTCATLMERYGVPELHRKIILGHAIRDITLGTYTHVSKEILISDIDLLP